MDSSICVAVITKRFLRRARRIRRFWMGGTISSDISTPRSPRATMMPLATSRMALISCTASGFSILAMMGMRAEPMCCRSTCTSSALRTNDIAT